MLSNCGAGEDSWESLGLQGDQPVHPKGNQFWALLGRTDVEAETPIFWPPDANNWLIGKDPDAGKDRRQEEKGTTEDEMVGWHHWLSVLNLSRLQETGEDRGVSRAAVHEVAKSLTWLSDWTELNYLVNDCSRWQTLRLGSCESMKINLHLKGSKSEMYTVSNR